MKRLLSTLLLDARLQWRNNVYAIIGVVAAVIAGSLRASFDPAQLLFFMPLVALSGVGISAFFLVGVLLLLERHEGTLDVVLVSPLRPAEYLASKMSTVTALALVEGLVIVLIAYPAPVSAPWLVLGVVWRASFVAAVGVAVGVRHRTITQFMMPAAGIALLVDLPVLWYFGFLPTSLSLAWPTLPALVFAKAAFVPVEGAMLVYAGLYGAGAIALAVAWALHSIDRFVVAGVLES